LTLDGRPPLDSAPVFRRIDHIGVAVEDLDAALPLWRDHFGMELAHRETVQEQGVEAALLDVGENHVELLAPLGPDTPVGKFLAKRGPGLHHIAIAVSDIDQAIAEARAKGMEMIDHEPRIGLNGTRIAFVHPKSVGGVLTEFVET